MLAKSTLKHVQLLAEAQAYRCAVSSVPKQACGHHSYTKFLPVFTPVRQTVLMANLDSRLESYWVLGFWLFVQGDQVRRKRSVTLETHVFFARGCANMGTPVDRKIETGTYCLHNV